MINWSKIFLKFAFTRYIISCCLVLSEITTNLVERSSANTYEVLALGEKIDDGLVLSEK